MLDNDNVLTITKLLAARDNYLLEIFVTYTNTHSNIHNACYNKIIEQTGWSMLYLNKMIVIHMTNTYNTMHETISRWLNSKRKKCHVLLERKRKKDNLIP